MTVHTLKQVSLNDVFLFLCVPCVNTNNNNNNKKKEIKINLHLCK